MRNTLKLLAVLAGLSGCHVVRKVERPVVELPEPAVEAVDPATHMAQLEGPPTDEDTERAARVVLAGLPEGYRPLVVHSPALDQVARARAWTAGLRNHRPAAAADRWLMGRVGEPATWHHGGWTWAKGGRDPDKRVLVALQKRARQLILRKVPYAFGAALIEINTGHWAGALVVAERPIAIEPTPRHIPVGTPWKLTGTLQIKAGSLSAFLLRQDGEVIEKSIAVKDGRFTLELADLPPGQHVLEVAGKREEDSGRLRQWINNLIELPILVGQPEPPPPRGRGRVEPDSRDATQLAAWLLAEINAERVRAGRPELVHDAALRALASTRAEMVAQDRRQDLDRLADQAAQQPGVPGGGFREFWGSSTYLGDRLDDLLTSPRLRARLLDAKAKWLGLYLAQEDEDGEDTRRYPTWRYHLVFAQDIPKTAPSNAGSAAR